jgi:hypothetical protein
MIKGFDRFIKNWMQHDSDAQVMGTEPSIDSHKINPYVLRVGDHVYERAVLGITELKFEEYFDIEYEHRKNMGVCFVKLYPKDEKQKFAWDLAGGELKVKALMNKWWQRRIIEMSEETYDGH